MKEITAAQLSCVFPHLESDGASAAVVNQLLGADLSTTCAWRNFLGAVGAETAGLLRLTQRRMTEEAEERFTGRGPLQLSGMANYRYCAALSSCRCADIVDADVMAMESTAELLTETSGLQTVAAIDADTDIGRQCATEMACVSGGMSVVGPLHHSAPE